jgi:glycosyltransferase involved in cell wall biosynthesis
VKVLHIISSVSRDGGGPARSSQGLVAALNAVECETWLASCRAGDVPWLDGVSHFAAPNGGEKLDGFFSRMIDEVKPDLIHLHGIWGWKIHLAAKMARQKCVPYIIAPRGMLEPWSLAQKKWKKRLAMWLFQRRDLQCAAALHATAESEAEQFRKLGFGNKIIVSQNGVNLPTKSIHASTPASDSNAEPRRALFVSRMHPKKGVLELVEVWAKARLEGWVCELVYTLNGEEELAYEAKVRARVKELGLSQSFVFTGALDDERKWEAYGRADLFVLPTYSENFGIVVAEALWAGVPVITTKGAPWEELESRQCGWWIDLPPTNSLMEALTAATVLPRNELVSMGQNGKRLVEEKYTWKAVCEKMIAGYKEVLDGKA